MDVTDPERTFNSNLWNKNFFLIILANCCGSLSFQLLTATLPIYVKQMSHSHVIIGAIIGVLTVTTIVIRPFVGRLADRWTRKGLLIIGFLIILVSVIGYHLIESISFLMLIRLLHGIGWGLTTTAANTMATDAIPKDRMAEGMGYYGLSSVFSMAVAPGMGLKIVDSYGFNTLFITTIAIIMLGLIIASCIKNEYNLLNKVSSSFNIEKQSLFEKQALKPSIINFFVSLTFGSITTYLALYAIELEINNIGLFFTVFAISLLIIRPIAGRLADQMGIPYVVIPGLLLISISLLILFYANTLTSILIMGVIYGFGLGAVQPCLQAMVVSNVVKERRGAANSTFLLSSDFGFGLGAFLWGVIVNLVGYRYMYLLVMIPAICALCIQFYTARMDDKNSEKDIGV